MLFRGFVMVGAVGLEPTTFCSQSRTPGIASTFGRASFVTTVDVGAVLGAVP